MYFRNCESACFWSEDSFSRFNSQSVSVKEEYNPDHFPVPTHSGSLSDWIWNQERTKHSLPHAPQSFFPRRMHQILLQRLSNRLE